MLYIDPDPYHRGHWKFECGGGGGEKWSVAQEIPKGRGVSRPNSLPDGQEND